MRLVLLLIILIFAGSCSDIERKKPKSVPLAAIWKGGPDGGCWIMINSITPKTLNVTIYFENGGTWDKGIFRKIGDCQMDRSYLTEEITSYDGVSLLTNQKCWFQK